MAIVAGLRRATARWWVPALGLLLVVSAVLESASYPSGPRIPALVASVLTAGAVGLHARSYRLMVGVVTVGLLGLTVVGIGETPMWAFVELLLVSFWAAEGLAVRESRLAVVLLVGTGIAFDFRSGESGLAGSLASPLVIVGAPALAGALLRRAREQTVQLHALTAELAEQRDRAAAAAGLAERARIAREIHDVVAHTVSVMLVQAGAAQNLLSDDHPAAEPVSAIRSTGKLALAELRRVVGVLRDQPAEDTHPQPTMAALPDLIAAARATGASVELDLDVDDLSEAPAGVQLTVFRTIQEALTNARRHAPGAAIHVMLRRERDSVVVRVDDDGPVRAAVHPPGFGLIGLRERADLYDGTCTAGPPPSVQGWRVELVIPVPLPSVRALS